ncbi:MAG: VanZ family protein [Leptolyngbyaceae cyanobacterium bins.302]|nr:VanZ family protein [Leptolyngbyaceae cyanobacterium bins.302]
MNDRKTQLDSSLSSCHQAKDFSPAWSRKIIVLAVVVVVVCTLYPFKFSLNGMSPLAAIAQSFKSNSSLLDIVANIILFAPLGFGLGGLLARRERSFLTNLVTIVLLCGGFSLAIEVFQVFLPGRRPTSLDVASNALGGVVGFLSFQGFGAAFYALAASLIQRSRSLLAKVSLKYLLVALGIYGVLASWLVVGWQGSSLKGWYDGFPLTIGNNYSFYHRRLEREVSGAWKGSVADVVLLDRSLSRSQVGTFFTQVQSFPPQDKSVVAAYSLRGEAGGRDLVGRSPELVWQEKPARMTDSQGASLSAEHWLQTSAPLEFATNRIRQTSQFTLSALITAGDSPDAVPYLQQIISLATPGGMGNFSLAQDGSNLGLILSVRRVNRSDRSNRQRIPNIFQDQNPHRLVVTYSGFVARIYVDEVNHATVIDMTPNRFQIMLYLLVLVPLAFLIALVASRVRRNLWLYLAVVGLGTVFPALMLEGFLASEGDRTIRLANLLLGMLIVGGTILVFKSNFKLPRQFAAAEHQS